MLRLNRNFLVSNTPRNKESIWDVKTSIVDNLTEPAEVIFLGDSTVRSAIHDGIVSESLGQKAVNLGLTGDLGVYGDYRILEYYLSKKRAPKSVVFWHTMDVWPRKLQDFMFIYTNPTLTELRDHYSNNYVRNPLKFSPILIENFMVNTLYLYRYKTFFRDAYTTMFHHTKELPVSQPVIYWFQTRTSPSKDNLFWLGKLNELCQENGITLIAGESPMLNLYFELPSMQEFLQKQQEELRNLYKVLGIKFLPGHYIFKPEETHFFNLDHLNDEGAVNASRFYGTKLKNELGL